MPSKDDIVRVKHMLDAAKDAISFARDKNRSSLDTDRMLVHSVVRCLEIIRSS